MTGSLGMPQHFLTEGNLSSLRLIWTTKNLSSPWILAKMVLASSDGGMYSYALSANRLYALKAELLPEPVPTMGALEWLHYTPALAVLLTMAPITCLPICCKGPHQPSCGLNFNNHNVLQGTRGPSCPLRLVPKCHNILWNEQGFAY